jgi:hypothetical protein
MSEIAQALGIGITEAAPIVHELVDSGDPIAMADGTDWKITLPDLRGEDYTWKFVAEQVV